MYLLISCYLNGIIQRVTCSKKTDTFHNVPGSGIHTLVRPESVEVFGTFWGSILKNSWAKIPRIQLYSCLEAPAAEGFGVLQDNMIYLTFIPQNDSNDQLLTDMIRMQSEQQNKIRLNEKKLAQLQLLADYDIGSEEFLKDFSKLNNELINQKRQLSILNATLNSTNIKLKQANSSLEQLNESIYHDLKEPLRSISAMSQLLYNQLDSNSTENSIQYVELIYESANKAQRMINDLMLYFKETHSGSTLPISANQLAQKAIDSLEELIHNRSAHVRLSIPLDAVLPTNFLTVFQNLLMNAIHYTPLDRTPEISLYTTTNEEGIVFCVKDNGIGLDKTQHQNIFKLFHRIQNLSSTSGSGIGLSITKNIVESFGGKIWVDSTPDQGSTFYFSFHE